MPGNPAQSRRGGMEFGFSMGGKGGSPLPNTLPFNILVIGDFSGPGRQRATRPLTQRQPRPVDLDALDGQLAQLGITLRLPGIFPNETPELLLSELADFHPDRLFAKLPAFTPLRELRKNLLNPVTFEAAAAQVRSWTTSHPDAPAPASSPAPTPIGPDSGNNPFAQLMGGKVAEHAATRPARATHSQVDAFIRNLVAPHVVAPRNPEQPDLLAAVDHAAGERLNAILHHPDFQALEAAWRGLDFLIHNIELDESLTISMLDLSREELSLDLHSTDDLSQTQLHRLLVRQPLQTPGGSPWSLLVGLYTFGPNDDDADLLQRLGQLARAAGAPLIAAAACPPNPSEAKPFPWPGPGNDTAADHLALAAPRLILRLPYGPATEPLDAFPFSEMPDQPVHDHYLWGNPALACACLIGQTFSQSGRPLKLGSIDQLGGLPLHVWTQDGEKLMTPPAEYWLTDADSEALAQQGLIPLLSVRGSDSISVAAFQTLSRRALPLNSQA